MPVATSSRLPLLLAIVFILAGCSTAPTLSPERAAKIKSIAVVCAADDSWVWESFNFFITTKRPQAGTDWRLAERSRQRTLAALKGLRLMTIPGVPENCDSKWDGQAGRKRLQDVVTKMAFPPDAVLVVSKGVALLGNSVMNAPSTASGFGVYRKVHLFQDYVTAFALLKFNLLDGRTGEVLSSASSSYPGPGNMRGVGTTAIKFLTYPGDVQTIAEWTDEFEAQPAAVKKAVYATFTDFIDKSVPYTLRQMGLVR